MFIRCNGEGPSASELDAYLDRLRALVSQGCRIKSVQVYTAARQTAEPWVAPLEDQELESIVERVRALGLSAEAYGGVGSKLNGG